VCVRACARVCVCMCVCVICACRISKRWCFHCPTGSYVEGRYSYIRQLKQLKGYSVVLPAQCLTELLRPWCTHSGQNSYNVIQTLNFVMMNGVANGFHITCKIKCASAKRNTWSAQQYSSVVEDYLQKDALMSRIIGPLYDNTLGNKIGVIPKKTTRIIVGLSSPDKASVWVTCMLTTQ